MNDGGDRSGREKASQIWASYRRCGAHCDGLRGDRVTWVVSSAMNIATI